MNHKPDDVVATHDVTRQEREDLQVALAEGVSTYARLMEACGDIVALAGHKAIWTAQADRLRALMTKFR